eukprot:365310-Chlamydomonas_euryale.AAC.9
MLQRMKRNTCQRSATVPCGARVQQPMKVLAWQRTVTVRHDKNSAPPQGSPQAWPAAPTGGAAARAPSPATALSRPSARCA